MCDWVSMADGVVLWIVFGNPNVVFDQTWALVHLNSQVTLRYLKSTILVFRHQNENTLDFDTNRSLNGAMVSEGEKLNEYFQKQNLFNKSDSYLPPVCAPRILQDPVVVCRCFVGHIGRIGRISGMNVIANSIYLYRASISLEDLTPVLIHKLTTWFRSLHSVPSSTPEA